MTSNSETRIGILTVSDRASRKDYADKSGEAVITFLTVCLQNAWVPVYRIIPDNQKRIEKQLVRMVDKKDCCLVITTGGTGPSRRDVTPEATQKVCEKILPGFGEHMRRISQSHVPTAILSRQTAGIRKNSLIVNLPGNPRAVEPCLKAVFPAIVDCLDILNDSSFLCNPKIVNVHQPHRKK